MNIGQHIQQRIAEKKEPFFSLEFFPPKDIAQWPSFFQTVERLKALDPLFASVTYGAGGSTQSHTLEITAKLKHEMQLEPMAHLTCVGASAEKLTSFLSALQESGINNVMALRGDAPKGVDFDWNACEFQHGSDLVRFARSRYPQLGIGVAGYPSCHPDAPSFASDWDYTAEKAAAGADFMVTQLFFDPREYFSLVDRMRERGINIPILPGILPVQSFESLRRTMSMCGANLPGSLYLDFEAAHAKGGAQAVREVGVAYAVQQIRQLLDGGAPGIHLYTLNMAETCLRIAEAVKSEQTGKAS